MTTNDTTAKWRPDPYARAKERWYDGARWTARIRNDGVESVDPLGATATIPFTNPTGITPKITTVERDGIGGVFDRVTSTIKRWFHRD